MSQLVDEVVVIPEAEEVVDIRDNRGVHYVRDVNAGPKHLRAKPKRHLSRSLAVPVLAYLVSRVIAIIGFAVGAKAEGISLVDALTSWDTRWYLDVATFGYPANVSDTEPSTAAFFPLYPYLSNGVAQLFGMDLRTAALAVSWVAGLAFVLGVWFLARALVGERAANASAILVSVLPGTFILSMGYPEALMLAFAAFCLLALHNEKWLLAGILGALATSTRSNAVALCFACAWAALFAIKSGKPRSWRPLWAPALSSLGVLGFLGYLWAHTGQADAWFRAEEAWGGSFDFATNFVDRLPAVVLEPWNDFNASAVGVGILMWAVLLGFFLKLRPPGYLTVYSVTVMFLTLISAVGPRPRFVLAAFPIVIGLGRAVNQWALSMIAAVSASLLVVLCVVIASTRYLTP